MAREINRLKPINVPRLKKPGMYPDGGGLYLQVTPRGRSWVFIYTLKGRAREMGLGPFPDVSLADARNRAAEARRLKLDGQDPIDVRRKEKAKPSERNITFKAAAREYLKTIAAEWRNAKHASQWGRTLETYAYPVLGSKLVRDIDTDTIKDVLSPIWTKKTETASRLRGRIESILDWATVHKYRSGENPARWRGHLSKAGLASPTKLKRAKLRHHPALPHAEVNAFIVALQQRKATAALALEFLILTAARTSEVMGATWGEFDLENSLWTVPANRIKAGKEHRVPLSSRALAILEGFHHAEVKSDHFVFPGGKEGKPLSNMALLTLLKRMKRDDLTVHGFRSTFRDWAAEQTNFPRWLAEKALAHTVGDESERAYQRSDLLEKRRRLMQDWAKYCNTVQKEKTGNVVKIGRG